VFTYSERQNTTANKMTEVVPKEVRAERSRMLHILSDKKKRHFYAENMGSTSKVLFESENHEGFLNGFTENYVKVKIPYQKEMENTIQSIKLQKVDFEGIAEGELIKDTSNLNVQTTN
ncbi:MAG: tRNA (N(6)-L-threonylcarbamoyladenosine(37)-C(2))-methylthiotransferase MtaB, partial [Flavobacteriales bacterium]|nr:tRNA (N(6)-L-threonylcarbamoyladenosine(37)-C(2))-methylthiotransferase MtaB [Flavobacteriales bacterium]